MKPDWSLPLDVFGEGAGMPRNNQVVEVTDFVEIPAGLLLDAAGRVDLVEFMQRGVGAGPSYTYPSIDCALAMSFGTTSDDRGLGCVWDRPGAPQRRSKTRSRYRDSNGYSSVTRGCG